MEENKQPSALTFDVLRKANVKRLPGFKNSKGDLTHTENGDNWLLSQWSNALNGETGEAANLIKKYERGDISFEELKPLLANELADVMTYLDLLAFRAGIDLGDATVNKFNAVSDRVGSGVKIIDNGLRCLSFQSDPANEFPGKCLLIRVNTSEYSDKGLDAGGHYLVRKSPDSSYTMEVLCVLSCMPDEPGGNPFLFSRRRPNSAIQKYYLFPDSILQTTSKSTILDRDFPLSEYPELYRYVVGMRSDDVGVYHVEMNQTSVF